MRRFCSGRIPFMALFLLALSVQTRAQSDLKPVYSEITRAQVLTWLDDETFAVGRWDGSLSIYRTPTGSEFSPKLVRVRVSADGSGVEMAATLDSRTLIFSDGSAAIGMWMRSSATDFDHFYRFTYDQSIGIANSAAHIGSTRLVTGHANGFAIVWRRSGDDLMQERIVDLRSPNPIPSPYPLKNIRGLANWKDGLVLSGSEDGDVVGFDPGDGSVKFRQRFNESAQRGINNIAVRGNYLLVVNCSVGATDKNLWLFEVTQTGLRLADSINLLQDTALAQSFDFDVDFVEKKGVEHFFASTQEGLLWEGHLENWALKVDKVGRIDKVGAAVSDVSPSGNFIASAAQDVFLFRPD